MSRPLMDGNVVEIWLTPDGGGTPERRDAVEAVAGVGLEGDRYAEGTGTYSDNRGPQRQVTLIESEVLETAARDYEVDLSGGRSRRNIVTAGMALNHLVGHEFTVGAARLRGVKLCEPCGHMERLSGQPRAARALVHRGGLNAEVLSGGTIRVGDAVAADQGPPERSAG